MGILSVELAQDRKGFIRTAVINVDKFILNRQTTRMLGYLFMKPGNVLFFVVRWYNEAD